MTRTASPFGPEWTRVTGGLYVRADNAQVWQDTYQPTIGARPASSGGVGTDGLPVREAHFYTVAAALAWIAASDEADAYVAREIAAHEPID
jgi:hypothetical protein